MREGNYGRKDRRISRAHREEMLLAAGLFFFVGGASDWDWLCGGRGAPHPAAGRGLRRLIFTGCGAVILLCGALLLLR